MISSLRYRLLLGSVVAIYMAGLLVTLFENDSAQFAVMAMRMVQENDFLNLYKGPEPYLDKPHMHFWLAALSYKIFGINHFAYRLPALMATLLGAYSTFALARTLYDNNTGKIAALIFMTAQTIVLSVIDVRTDAVLTGFTVLALWQFVVYIQNATLSSMVLGAFAAGIAFSTKGQIALVVIGLPILCYLASTKKWKMLFDWKVLLGLFVFILTISPMLYAYYQQFDMHPELVIRGRNHRSGVCFILWEQSFERLSGEGIGKNSSDYFFFFHTFLWVFLPWTIAGILAYGNALKTFINRFKKPVPTFEMLTFGGITLIFLVISFAQFKLPHYLNITMPLFAILTAAFLVVFYKKETRNFTKVLLGVQYFILAIFVLATALFSFYVFQSQDYGYYIVYLASIGLLLYYLPKREKPLGKMLTTTILASLLLNLCLNLHFYPQLLRYQAGSEMAKLVKQENIDVNQIYKIRNHFSWAFDFYNKKPLQILGVQKLAAKHNIWVYVDQEDLKKLQAAELKWDVKYEKNQFRITRLQANFLNPATRERVLNKMFLVHLP